MRRTLSILAGCALATAACKSLYEDAKKPLPDPHFENTEIGRLQFDDVPVPAGFTLRTERLESFSFERGSFRIGELLYDGPTPSAAVASYYRDRLGQHGWSVEEEGPIEKGTRIFATKGRSQATIAITRGRRRAGATSIEVVLEPRPALFSIASSHSK